MKMKRFNHDSETGEVTSYNINDETGEPILDTSQRGMYVADTHILRDPVTIPKQYLKFTHSSITKTKKFQSLKANILAGSNRISHRMLLIPTLMVFPRIICIMLMILEIYLHAKCHKKNKMLKDPNLYYQSPFHILTSKFCSVCRDCDTASKVRQMQDKRRHRYDYFRRIAM